MNAATLITDYVLERMGDEPIDKRIELTSALAEVAATPDERDALLKHVGDLRDIQNSHRQLVLHFRATRPAA